ncbi:MAG: DUF2339 domain-containing protein [Methylococcaceae bacterium]|nr:MAG: DUF2339 domain-containing protein [Methylococcaceae bacterium]
MFDFWLIVAVIVFPLATLASCVMLFLLLVRQNRTDAAVREILLRIETVPTTAPPATAPAAVAVEHSVSTPDASPLWPAEAVAPAPSPPATFGPPPSPTPEGEGGKGRRAFHDSPSPAEERLIPTASETPATAEPFDSAAKTILRGIWNWIVVGEEHRPQGVAMEYAIASNWLLRIGVVILVTGIAFFLKYSIDNNLLGEHARVALSLLAGVGMITGGTRLLGRQYHLFGQGMLGGGIATLYFSVFAAFNFYHLIGAYPAFALMILVTASAGWLAVRLDSMLVAIFGVIGGYSTPILLSTGQVNFVGLFAYMLLLGLGILSVNYYKKWHLLNYLSFVFNYALFFGAMGKYQDENFWQVMPFLAAFFVLYSTMVFLFCLVKRRPSNLLDLLGLMVNAGIFFLTSYNLIEDAFGQIWLAALSLGLAAFYVAHVYYCLARRVLDKAMLLSFTGLAALFTTLTLPLVLSDQWLTLSWSIQALVMLWIAARLHSEFLRQIAYLLYGIVLLRFGFVDLPGQFFDATPAADMPLGQFALQLVEHLFTFGVPIASLGLAYRLMQQSPPAAGPALDAATDIQRPWLGAQRSTQLAVLLAGAMLFLFLHLELNQAFAYLFPPLRLPVLTLLWVALCLVLLLRWLAYPEAGAKLLWFFSLALLVKLCFFDSGDWNLASVALLPGDESFSLGYGGEYSLRYAIMRLLDFAAIIGFFGFAFISLTRRRLEAGFIQSFFGAAALSLLFVYLTLETNTALAQYVPGLRSGGVSILWSIYALAAVLAGIAKNYRRLRLVGLGLFALVAWKVFFVDLARLDQIYRILAFIVLGLLALGGSFAYMKYRLVFTAQGAEKEST